MAVVVLLIGVTLLRDRRSEAVEEFLIDESPATAGPAEPRTAEPVATQDTEK